MAHMMRFDTSRSTSIAHMVGVAHMMRFDTSHLTSIVHIRKSMISAWKQMSELKSMLLS
jgi:hypothetical protein